MTHTFLDEAGQLDLKAHLKDVPDIVTALVGVACDSDGYRQRITFDPRVSNPSASQPIPYDGTVDDAVQHLANELAGWIRHMLDHRGMIYDGPAGLEGKADWLSRHVVSLAMTPGSEEAPRYVGEAVKRARRAARMSTEAEAAERYAKLRAKCDPRVAEIRNEQWDTATCSRMAGQLGLPITQRRIKYLTESKRLTRLRKVKGVDGAMHSIYRFGDVLDAAQADAMEETA